MAINLTNIPLNANALTSSLAENKAVKNRFGLLLKITFFMHPIIKMLRLAGP